MMHKAWSSIEEVPYCFFRSYVKFQGHTALNIVEFDPNWAFPDCNSSLNSPMAMKCCTKLETAKERCPIVFQGHPNSSQYFNYYRHTLTWYDTWYVEKTNTYDRYRMWCTYVISTHQSTGNMLCLKWDTCKILLVITNSAGYSVWPHLPPFIPNFQGPVSSNKTSYCMILQSLEVTRFPFRIVRSLWNILTGTSAVGLLICLSNFKAMQ